MADDSKDCTRKAEYDEIVGDLNESIADFVLGTLRAHGYRASDVHRGDGYFVFQFKRCSVVSFRLSRVLPGWRFGMWLHAEALLDDSRKPDAPVIELFCQHETQIDKFKPSASALCVTIPRSDFSDRKLYADDERFNIPCHYNLVMEMVVHFADQIRLHPFLSYAGVMDHGYPIDQRLVPMTVREVAEWHADRAVKRLQVAFWLGFARMKAVHVRREPALGEVKVADNSRCMYPPLTMSVRPAEGASEDEWWDAMTRVFPKTMEYGKYGLSFPWEPCLRCRVVTDDGIYGY